MKCHKKTYALHRVPNENKRRLAISYLTVLKVKGQQTNFTQSPGFRNQ